MRWRPAPSGRRRGQIVKVVHAVSFVPATNATILPRLRPWAEKLSAFGLCDFDTHAISNYLFRCSTRLKCCQIVYRQTEGGGVRPTPVQNAHASSFRLSETA